MLEGLLVGGISVAVGLLAVATAIANWEWTYRLNAARWIGARCGRGGARVFYATLGLMLIVLGVCIALGLRPVG